MSKVTSAADRPAAAEPPKPVAYGRDAMTDLSDEVEWPSCEVLNATSKDGPERVMKQGLRDQPELLLESDADEQVRRPNARAPTRRRATTSQRPSAFRRPGCRRTVRPTADHES